MNKIYNLYSYIYYYLFGFYILDGLKTSAKIVQENDHVLDIGIGTGIILKYFPKTAKIVGIDLNEAMLDVAKQNYGNNTIQFSSIQIPSLLIMDATKLEFEDETFDKIIMTHVLSTTPQPEKMLDEAIRVLKKGGELAIVNHFTSKNIIIHGFERGMSYMSELIGFNSIFEMKSIVNHPKLELLEIKPVNFWSLWHFIHLRKK